DLHRIRESCQERSSLLRIAPHLVRPLPILVPTYRGLMKGRMAMRTALAIYDAITWDRNRGVPSWNRIPRGRILSRRECLELYPALDRPELTGGALFHDGQMYNQTRLGLAFVRSAAERGAAVANYAEVAAFLREGDRIVGVRVTDRIGGGTFDVRGRVVINAAGPWAEPLLRRSGLSLERTPTFSRDACFVVPRRLTPDTALAIQGATNDPDALLSRGERHLFLVPWRHCTLVGVWHVVHRGAPDDFTVTRADLDGFIAEINGALPGLDLTHDDVALWNAGLVLFGENDPRARNLSYGKRSWIVDHERIDGIADLLTVIGVRYTTARGVARQTVDRAMRKMGQAPNRSPTAHAPIWGGDVDDLSQVVREAAGAGLEAPVADALAHNYGSRFKDVLAEAAGRPELLRPIGGTTTLRAEVLHAVRREMAQCLEDVVLRRTDLGTADDPGDAALHQVADIVAAELGWDAARSRSEVERLRSHYLGRRGTDRSPVTIDAACDRPPRSSS
ncbi:MAG TPA: FAD-dependent oxidoreductase, partial [Candidatus Polarisedimenticolaceae bacterium]|nr:FAD-dependent oxidoreductase [Candidatus Polarisedimenticolaceae bacterium]